MNFKERLLQKSNLWHVGAVVLFLFISCIYFYPALKGYSVDQDDVKNWIGASQEIVDYREGGEQVGWTNSMFSGMPGTQISLTYQGKQVPDFFRNVLSLWLPAPISILFVYFIGFYVLAISFRAKPLVAMIGALAYGLSSYFIIIIEVGHITKALAIGYAPLLIAGFIFSYRWKNWVLGVAFSALFMCWQLSANHIQITYYLIFVLIGLGVVELIRHLQQEGGMIKFAKVTGGLLVAYFVALMINYGNIKGTQEYGEYTTRGGTELTISPDGTNNTAVTTGGLDREYITAWSYGKSETFTFLVPNFKGGLSTRIGDNKSNKDLVAGVDSNYRNDIKGSSQYWGDQPGTSGPVYIGCIVVLLALLSLYYSKDQARWALLIVTVLTVMLSWGKNFMWLTDFFLDYLPGYDKFRSVTIILVIAEICVPLLGVLFLQRIMDAKDEIVKDIKPFFFITGGLVFILLVFLAAPGLFNTFLSLPELAQYDELMARTDLAPEQLTNIEGFFTELESVRISIFRGDVMRTLLLVILAGGAIFAYLKSAFNQLAFGAVIGFLVLIDLLLVDMRYLNTETTGKDYKQWTETYKQKFPYVAANGEQQLLSLEVQENPILFQKIDSSLNALESEIGDADLTNDERKRRTDWVTFRTLNRYTNFRVYDAYNPYNSTYVSYFNKAIGGYHGAKLGRYQELIEFHLSRNNPAVFDMLNMKYTITPQYDATGKHVVGSMLTGLNTSAMGNAWLAKDVVTVENADQEIMAMNSARTYKVQSFGDHQLMINGKPDSSAVVTPSDKVDLLFVMGFDSLGNKMDTLIQAEVPYPAVTESMPLLFKLSQNGIGWDYAMNADSTVVPLIGVELAGRSGWDPETQTIMDKRFSGNITSQSYSGDGTITMTSYHPDHLTYSFSSTEKQLVVFSEIYHPVGWKAYVDDVEVPISRVNYVLRAIEVPAGDSRIELVYKSESYESSTKIAWAGTSALIILFALSFFYGKRQKSEA